MTLREKVFMYRASNSLTQREFAKRARVSEPTIVAFETGKRVSRITETKIELALANMCTRCGSEADHHGLMFDDGEKLCWWCWKKQDLKDQRDWEE